MHMVLVQSLQDTVTGFLLAGVGDVTKKDAANFLIVHAGMYKYTYCDA